MAEWDYAESIRSMPAGGLKPFVGGSLPELVLAELRRAHQEILWAKDPAKAITWELYCRALSVKPRVAMKWINRLPKRRKKKPARRKPKVLQTYFIQAGDGDIKIGTSTDPEKHMANMRAEHTVPLTLLAVAPGNRQGDFHRAFRGHHVNGKWFRPGVEVLNMARWFAPVLRPQRGKIQKYRPLIKLKST